MPEVGDPAPDFTLEDQSGRMVRLSEQRGKPVVIYFYPADFTPGCAVETRAFAKQSPKFTSRNALVLGVSRQGKASHHKFAESCGAEFPLLADVEGEVSAAYGVNRRSGLAQRVTVLVAPDGTIAGMYRNEILPWRHVTWSLKELDRIQRSAGPVDASGGAGS
ncbi:MAG: peroxiredoxin [Thermoplasmatota archaeon]